MDGSPSRPNQGERRRSRIGAVLLWGIGLPAGLLAVLAVAGWAARLPIARTLGPELAEHALGAPVAFDVAALDIDRIVLTDLRLGDEDGPTVDRLTLDYDILAPALTGIRLDGPRGRARIDDDGAPAIDGLPPALFAGGAKGSAGGVPALPREIAVTALDLTLATAAGAHRVTGDLTLTRGGADGALLPFELTADLKEPGGGTALDLGVEATADGLTARGGGRVALDAWTPLLRRAIPAVRRASGTLTLTFDGLGGRFDPTDPPRTAEALLAALTGAARIAPDGVRVTFAGLAPLTLTDAPITLRPEGSALTIAPPPDFALTLAEAPPALSGAMAAALPAFGAPSIRLTPRQGAAEPPVLRLSRAEAGWTLATEGQVRAMMGPLALVASPRVVAGETGPRATLPAGWYARLAPSPLAGGVRLRRPLVVEGVGPATLTPSDGADAIPTLAAAVSIADASLVAPDGTAVDLFLPDLRTTLGTDGVSLTLTGAALRQPTREIRATDVSATLDGPPDGPYAVTLRAPILTRNDAPVVNGASALDATLRRSDSDGWHADGRLTLLDGTLAARFEGALTGDAAPPRLSIETDPIRYVPDGLQPGAISPLLADLFPEATGSLSLAADLRIPADGMTGTGRIHLEDIGFAAGLARIDGLEGTITLDLARPPATAPDQRLSARLAVAGLPAADLSLAFALDDGARLLIDRLTLDLLGGRLAVEDGRYDPLADSFDGRVALEGLDLDRAFEALAVEGIAGTGVLSGGMRVTLAPSTAGGDGKAGGGAAARLDIGEGRVEAAGPGQLSLDHPAVRDYLQGRNQAVDLMIEALKDFRYDRLSAGLRTTPAGAAVLELSIFGRNPAVLDGQPFDLNLSVETDLGELIATAGQVFAATDGLLERLAREARGRGE